MKTTGANAPINIFAQIGCLDEADSAVVAKPLQSIEPASGEEAPNRQGMHRLEKRLHSTLAAMRLTLSITSGATCLAPLRPISERHIYAVTWLLTRSGG